jgi:hypothetical protein
VPRQEVSKNESRLLAAQHTRTYTPPDHDPSAPQLAARSPLSSIRIGREFDWIMREARQAGVKKRGALTINTSTEDEEHSIFASS